MKLKKETKDVQVSSLIYCMGPEAETVYSSFSFSAATDRDNYDLVLGKFDEHFIPKKNVIFERARFNLRRQQKGETIETYVRHLHELAENCEFKEMKNELIRDRLVIGMLDSGVSQQLQMTTDLTLEDAITTCKIHEMVRMQNAELMTSQKNAGLDSIARRSTDDVSDDETFMTPYRREDTMHCDQVHRRPKCDKCGYDKRRSHARGSCPAQAERC